MKSENKPPKTRFLRSLNYASMLIGLYVGIFGGIMLIVCLTENLPLIFKVLSIAVPVVCFFPFLLISGCLHVLEFDDAGIHVRNFKKEVLFIKWEDVNCVVTCAYTPFPAYGIAYEKMTPFDWRLLFYCDRRSKILSAFKLYLPHPDQFFSSFDKRKVNSPYGNDIAQRGYEKYYNRKPLTYKEFVAAVSIGFDLGFTYKNKNYYLLTEKKKGVTVCEFDLANDQKTPDQEEWFTSLQDLLDRFQIEGQSLQDIWPNVYCALGGKPKE